MTSYFDDYPELRGIESMDAFTVARTMIEKVAAIRAAQMAWLIDKGFAVVDGFEDGDGEPLYRLPRGLSLDPAGFIAREAALLQTACNARPGEDCTWLRLAAAALVLRYRAATIGQRAMLRLTMRLAA